jgi:hypothetical protein
MLFVAIEVLCMLAIILIGAKIVAGSAQVLTIGWLRSDFRLARIFVQLLGCSASLAVGSV